MNMMDKENSFLSCFLLGKKLETDAHEKKQQHQYSIPPE